MELILTKEQKRSLNKRGMINADALQRIFKASVQDQQKMLLQAEKIRKQQKTAR